jgi:hypothetical protein
MASGGVMLGRPDPEVSVQSCCPGATP